MRPTFLLSLLLAVIIFSCKNSVKLTAFTTKIAFGSCANQDKSQPLLSVAADLVPDVFLFLGDNIYGDSRNMDTLQAKYAKLGDKPEFQQLWNTTKVLAVWDDHDYGENDAGRHYPSKAESKDIFMDFWQVPMESDRHQHEGIYGTEMLQKKGHNIQLILLDTRTFRDDLQKRAPSDSLYKNDYIPYDASNIDSTFLGKPNGCGWKSSCLSPLMCALLLLAINLATNTMVGNLGQMCPTNKIECSI